MSQYYRLRFLLLCLPVMALVLLVPSLQGHSQDGEKGIVVRAFAVTAPSGEEKFNPGTPIPESEFKDEAAFTALLKKRNPKWGIVSLGKLSTPSAAEIETPDFKAAAKIFSVREENMEENTVEWSARVPRESLHYPEIAGSGASGKRPMMSLPSSNEAYLVNVLQTQKRHRVAIFLSFINR